MKQRKNESEVFADLIRLCSSNGFIHILSYITVRDCLIFSQGELDTPDFGHWYSNNKLLRTEISTLQGLMLKTIIKCDAPEEVKFIDMINSVDLLMQDLHDSMLSYDGLALKNDGIPDFNKILSAKNSIKESIFYGSESAYPHQFLDLGVKKYQYDSAWIEANKGFSICDAKKIIDSLQYIIINNFNSIEELSNEGKLTTTSYLKPQSFTAEQVSLRSKVEVDNVIAFLNTFSFGINDTNNEFNETSDFNRANELPILKIEDQYTLFQSASLSQAFYENPTFWFLADKSYLPTATKNRGLFTEEFAYERLALIFGKENVFINLDLYKTPSKRICEIDVLILFGSKAIILQAKSKALTIKARKGDKETLDSDFSKAIQSAYDQAFLCSEAILNPRTIVKNCDGKEINLERNISEIYPVTLLSEHFPSLLYQTANKLVTQKHEIINPPFIMDVFTLDILTEFLTSPLYLISYIDRRCKTFGLITAGHELTIFSFHLKYNLWLQDDLSMLMLHDDVSVDLEIAVLSRTQYADGLRTPEGILTNLVGTSIGKLINSMNCADNRVAVELGLILLKMSEKHLNHLSDSIDYIAYKALQNTTSDFSIGMKDTGITFHANNDNLEVASLRLENHMIKKKYEQKASTWFGVLISPVSQKVRRAHYVESEWQYSQELEDILESKPKESDLGQIKKKVKFKMGRNDKCSCGSGKKHKKCCAP
jgi:hypothetical protein